MCIRDRDDVVHAIERAQHRGLAAARRADERGDLVGVDAQGHAAHRAERAVVDLDVLAVENDRGLGQLSDGLALEDDSLPGRRETGGLDGCDHGILLGHGYLLSARRAVNMRATSVTMNVRRTRVSAAAHARSCAATNDELALPKICTDSAVFASLNMCAL